MSVTVQEIVKYNPFIMGSDLLRKIMLLGMRLEDVVVEILILVGLCVFFILLVLFVKKITKEKFLAKGYKKMIAKRKNK